MKQVISFGLIFSGVIFFCSCSSHEQTGNQQAHATAPVIKDSGALIEFPKDSITLAFFKEQTIGKGVLNASLSAPAYVAATSEGGSLLFNNPDNAASYTAMQQNRINIRQKQLIIEQKKGIIQQKQKELDRFKDLASHGAGTGKDVADAQTDLLSAQTDLLAAENELADEKNAVLQHEADLRVAGFDPSKILTAPAGKAWIICDIPESQVGTVKQGNSCVLHFTSYPEEAMNATIDNVADVVDNTTRMVKVRILIANTNNKLKAGMYATVQFPVSDGIGISVPTTSLVTVQGKNYVFVKTAENVFQRKAVITGQQINNNVIILAGLNDGDNVVTEGAMQLKGFSFGY